ncbi:hypothetical protein IFM89_021496 [Coptis chinensis]|uniref:Uncharacterized protein n=1 Tax=Coptis chinensis TaxID=261450 RepID=A0A835H7V4_9MAGN|nr:hypothetical protein IFM89_018475 [Coptis chinensis]KAF9593327.1 hypothetical protein IFM89_021496 [Coptis chinensis]
MLLAPQLLDSFGWFLNEDSHISQLKNKLQALKKGSSTMSDYLQQVKQISDNLMAAGVITSDSDLVDQVLRGLTHEYDSFCTSIRLRTEDVSFDEH